MLNHKQFTAIWFSVLVIISYLILYFSTEFVISKFVADWFALIGLSFMSASTTPAAWAATKNGIKSDRDRFIFSYWLVWTIILWQRVWIIVLAKTGTPDFLVESPISGLLAVLITMSAAFGAAAPLSGEVPPHRKEVILFAIAAGFSGVIAGIAIGVYIVTGWDI